VCVQEIERERVSEWVFVSVCAHEWEYVCVGVCACVPYEWDRVCVFVFDWVKETERVCVFVSERGSVCVCACL